MAEIVVKDIFPNPFITVFYFSLQKGKGQSCEITAAAGASVNGIRLFPGHLHLPDRLLADDGLMEANMVHHTAERILRIGMRHRILHRFADGDSEAAGTMRIFSEQLAPVIGLVARAWMHGRAPGVHEHPAIWLLLVAHLDHVNVAFEAEQFARQRQR